MAETVYFRLQRRRKSDVDACRKFETQALEAYQAMIRALSERLGGPEGVVLPMKWPSNSDGHLGSGELLLLQHDGCHFSFRINFVPEWYQFNELIQPKGARLIVETSGEPSRIIDVTSKIGILEWCEHVIDTLLLELRNTREGSIAAMLSDRGGSIRSE